MGNAILLWTRDWEDGWLLGKQCFSIPTDKSKTYSDAVEYLNIKWSESPKMIIEKFYNEISDGLNEMEYLYENYSNLSISFKEFTLKNFNPTITFQVSFTSNHEDVLYEYDGEVESGLVQLDYDITFNQKELLTIE